MPSRSTRRAAVVITSILASCSRGSGDSPNVPNEAPDVAAASQAIETTSPGKPTADVAVNPQPDASGPPPQLGGAFAQEAQARTGVKPQVEDAFAAFEAKGFPLSDIKQGLGRTSAAQYCSFGTTAAAARVVMCEYADAAAAAAALPKVRAQVSDERRRVEVRGRLMLTMLASATTPEATRERDAMFEVFAAVE